MVKRLLLLSTGLLLVLPAIANAQAHRPTPQPTHGARPPAQRPPAHRPPAHKPPAHKPPAHRPPVARPPAHRPPAARPPVHRPRPPHRPGAGRPPHFRPIHRPVFHYPHGWAYRRWAIGVVLPRLFLSNSYYFDNYADLDLGPPPYGYRWVRYGPDLLMVNVRTGRIADVIYGAFY